MPGDTVWVFGYGSLVSPESLSLTIGRPVDRDDGFAPAFLEGYGRRWNYGSIHQRGRWHGPFGRVECGVVVSLGLAIADGERTNGVAVRVGEEELAALDWRERDYEMTDVTARVHGESSRLRGEVFTFVPRPSSVERYERHRDAGTAAIRHSYVEVVERAFGDLGARHLDEYVTGTPVPDVPVVVMEPVAPAD